MIRCWRGESKVIHNEQNTAGGNISIRTIKNKVFESLGHNVYLECAEYLHGFNYQYGDDCYKNHGSPAVKQSARLVRDKIEEEKDSVIVNRRIELNSRLAALTRGVFQNLKRMKLQMARRRNPAVANRTIRTDAGLDHMTSTSGRSKHFDLRSSGFCPRGHKGFPRNKLDLRHDTCQFIWTINLHVRSEDFRNSPKT
ncbi:hypothetical protein pdam_00007981 [Pocillopora damicornis]|uniref:Uncharacterized protein n=1 Tax=Pocillopora damicornis TaxID=46731 RepID=A0A3M6U4S4_POCDA|nr:hypothetical protein pdam_00007981 [Pocillopora damicornis]